MSIDDVLRKYFSEQHLPVVKQVLLEIILAKKPHREAPKLIANSYFNQGADEYEAKIRELFK